MSKNAAISPSSSTEFDWIIDSGTSKHMTPFQSIFANFKPYRIPVITATGQRFFTESFTILMPPKNSMFLRFSTRINPPN
ncbi:uncharacterized protein N7506_007068 [Penicillium brevicompactum]|uniref:uncharacterized protein n=1 Tax=Penicillium brevicompactum TaxID=5074 RepID=UPI00253FED72|nr:uncharacterized protein N7506_007068 [Penicillium brevicompactum]KAJ5333285.1 hypothetical protein N7506_007068 [Penicillium brevicompactum]